MELLKDRGIAVDIKQIGIFGEIHVLPHLKSEK